MPQIGSSSHITIIFESCFGECGYVRVCASPQLINEFVAKEGILMDGVSQAEVLLGRDTRPSGDALLEAARQVWTGLKMLGVQE